MRAWRFFALGSVDEALLIVVYNLAEFVNKSAFVLACWSAAKSESEGNFVAISLWIFAMIATTSFFMLQDQTVVNLWKTSLHVGSLILWMFLALGSVDEALLIVVRGTPASISRSRHATMASGASCMAEFFHQPKACKGD